MLVSTTRGPRAAVSRSARAVCALAVRLLRWLRAALQLLRPQLPSASSAPAACSRPSSSLFSFTAAASPFAPPATERHAAFLKLVDAKAKAKLLARYTRCADYAALAAEAGVALFGADSLIVAQLRTDQARAICNQTDGTAESCVLERRAWVVLVAFVLPQLQGRLDAGALLPGHCRWEEEAYYVYTLQAAHRASGQPVPLTSDLLGHPGMSYVGYTAALHAAWLALNLLPVQAWRQDQVGRAQAFVLAVLDLIPRTGALPVQLACEVSLVALIERFMYPSKYGAFCGAVLAKWRSAAVTEVLRARGTLSGDPAAPPPRPVLG